MVVAGAGGSVGFGGTAASGCTAAGLGGALIVIPPAGDKAPHFSRNNYYAYKLCK